MAHQTSKKADKALIVKKKTIILFFFTFFVFLNGCEPKQNIVIQNIVDTSKSTTPQITKPSLLVPQPEASTQTELKIEALVVEPLILEMNLNQEKKIEKIFLKKSDQSISELKSFDSLEFHSGDESLATISKDGVVKAIKEGATPITIRLGDKTGTLVVNIKSPPSSSPIPTGVPQTSNSYKSLNVDQASYTLNTLETKLVTLTILLNELDPNTGKNLVARVNDQTKAEWSSSNNAVASISASGMISANSTGTSTMSVKFGGLTKTFGVTVVSASTPTSVSPYKELWMEANYNLKINEAKVVHLTIILNEIDPETGTNKVGFLSDQTKAEWSSSDTNVASISSSGVISSNSVVGTATITVKYGGLTKTFTVTVKAF